MKQLLQSLGSGQVTVADVPAPAAAAGTLQILTSKSLVSAGTERMLVSFSRSSLLSKIRQQPDRIHQVLEKMRTDGVVATLESVRSKLDQPLAPGYCNVGTVLATGEGVDGFAKGDRVVSNGHHAEVVVVPQNLCARIPDAVDDESAVFAVLAAIGLQGVRLVAPTLGESIVVTGLGLIGLIVVQILRANGCRVLGIDRDPARLALARRFGATTVDLSAGDDAVAEGMRFSRGRGVDAVLICAATQSSEPVSQAAKMCRKRGRIVLVGVTGLELSRSDFYEKELSFQVSCSYGPGRYDPVYEDEGHDYPIGFVRWTEQRNFEAALDLMASGALDVKSLISHRFDIGAASEAYDLLVSEEPSLGIMLNYGRDSRDRSTPSPAAVARTVATTTPERGMAAGEAITVAFLGAGNYGSRVLMPVFKSHGAALRTVVSSGGVTAVHHGKKQGFALASTDAAATIEDPAVRAVVVATRHDSHASLVMQALRARKHVFVEKPLCLTLEELAEIEAVARSGSALLMVGFNRRFSPHVQRMKSLLTAVSAPKVFVMTVNAGAIPASHWLQNPAEGGGRLVGEGCHFVDLLRFLAGSPISSVSILAMQDAMPDSASITLQFADGSLGTIHYLANGSRAFPKERLEVFAAGRVLQLDNFRRLRAFGWSGFPGYRTWRQDKGQSNCVKAFLAAVRDGAASPIPLAEIVEVSRTSIEVQQAVR